MVDRSYGAVLEPEWDSLIVKQQHPIDGSSIFTVDGAESTGRDPIVLLHGVGNNGAIYAPILPPLAELGPVAAPTLAPDLLTDWDEQRPAAFAGLVDWLAAIHAPPWRLVGHSMGGVITGLLLRARPDLVSGAILLNSPLPGTVHRIRTRDTLDRHGRALLALKTISRISALGRPRLHPRLRRAELGLVRTALRGFAVDPGGLDDQVISRAIMSSRTTDGLDFLELARQLPDWESEPHTECPVEIVLGDADPLIEPEDFDDVRGYYPEATVHVADECGHFAHLEQPELTVGIIEGFMLAGAA